MAVSVDPPERNALLRRRLGAEFTFLSDPGLTLIDHLGIRYRRRHTSEGSLAVPSQFLVDREGVIRWVTIATTWRKRPPPRRVLAGLAASGLSR